MRYSFTKKEKTEQRGKTVTTTLMTKIKPRPSDSFIQVVEKTRLDHLAYKFYGNPTHWWVIASANSIAGKMYAEPGTQLRIPKNIHEIIQDHIKVNS
jgi:hypothetical protein